MADWVPVVVFPSDTLVSKGTAGFSAEWCEDNGEPPENLLLHRAERPRKPVILKGARRQAPNKDVAIPSGVFNSLLTGAPGEKEGIEAEYRSAGYPTRIWYTPGARIDVIAAVTSAALAVVSAVVAFSADKHIAIVALIVFILGVGGAIAKLASDLRKAAG